MDCLMCKALERVFRFSSPSCAAHEEEFDAKATRESQLV
jgi:hypothetical protein